MAESQIPPLWTRYHARLVFFTKVCGSQPADPDLIKKWIEVRQPAVKPPGGKSIDEIQEEVFASLPGEDEQYSMLVFARQNGGLVVRADTVRAHLKDCARVLSAQYTGRIKGERAFSTRVINGLYPDPQQYWLPIVRPDGAPVTTADGTVDKAIHVRGPRGEALNALKQFEYVEPAR